MFLLELSVEYAHLPMAIVIGTVTKSEIVERRRIEARFGLHRFVFGADKITSGYSDR